MIIQNRLLLLWGVDASIVTEIIDEENKLECLFGYVIGTTRYHVLQGEEAFIIRYDKKKKEVSYTIYSYSKPQALLVRLTKPLLHYKQRQFARDAIDFLKQQVQSRSISE